MSTTTTTALIRRFTFTVRGAHGGVFLGIAPAGALFRIADGRIVDARPIEHLLGLLQQRGGHQHSASGRRRHRQPPIAAGRPEEFFNQHNGQSQEG